MTVGVPITRSAMRAKNLTRYLVIPMTCWKNAKESMFDSFAQRLVDHFMATPSTVNKRVGIKRLKALEATTL